MIPYGVISDTHNHGWSAFATVLPTGVNSRLQMILDETWRAAKAVKDAGGDTLFHGGDLFHVRGSIAPSVLNPTLALYKKIITELGLKVVIIAGNHDLESKEAHRVSSAITALEEIGCTIINEPTVYYRGSGSDMMCIPWIPKIADLKRTLEDPKIMGTGGRDQADLIIHAPVDGVIAGIPDHGLDGAYLASLGFRTVFAGHYHSHKEVVGGVFSIGSLTPQTWSDVGHKTGFLTVTDAGVKYNATHAPGFVEIDGSTDPADIPLIVDGNYVRAKINDAKKSEVEDLRQFLTDSGAKGVTILEVKSPKTPARSGGVTLKAGATLDQNITDFINAGTFAKKPDLAVLCSGILATVRSVK